MIETIVRKKIAVFLFAIMIIIIGISSYKSLPRESAPEVRRPLIFITVVYPGVSAADMERLITTKIEDELDGLNGLSKITSTSNQGMSQITAEFTADIEVETALRNTRDRVDIAKQELPENAEEPVIQELDFSNQPIFIMTLSNPSGLESLESTADFFETEFDTIQGVREVSVSGDLDREVAVEVNPALLRQYGFSLNDIIQSINNEHVTIPGGTLETSTQTFTLKVTGEIVDPDRFDEIVIQKDEKKEKLSNIAKVNFKYKKQETLARVNGKPAISISIKKRSGENIIDIVDRAKSIIEENKDKIPFGTEINYTFDESKHIRNMVADLENNIMSGLVLVLVVTFFFLGPINATFVSLAIPFSMLLSFFIIESLGITLNMVVLFSLIIALGMLVDNGIVIVENIYRHGSEGKSRVKAAIEGTKEVAMPIATSTLTTILAFFPIIFMPDIMGEFMSYIPKTVIIVLSSSLVVALTITTVFCASFLKINEKQIKKVTQGNGAFLKFQAGYEKILTVILDHWSRIIGALVVCFLFAVAGIIVYSNFGKETIFFPSLDPEVSIVDLNYPAGTPIEETDSRTDEVESMLAEMGFKYDTLQTTIGKRSNGGFNESNRANIRIGFLPFVEREEKSKDIIDRIKHKLPELVGVEAKISEMQGGPPRGRAISYEVVGEDYTTLGKLSDEILKIINKHSEAMEEVDSDYEAIKPEIAVEIDREKAARYGLNTRRITSTIRAAMNGSIAGKYRWQDDEYDIIVRYDQPYRNSLTKLRDLIIVDKGVNIPLNTIAQIDTTNSVNAIKRLNRKRTVSVWADFKYGIETKEAIRKQIIDEIAAIETPLGYRIQSGEGEKVRNEAQEFLGKAFLIAIMLIFIVMVLQFNSMYQPFVIMVSVMLSVGGVFWGLTVFQQTFVVIMSGIGTISLAGVVVNNAIVMIDYINQLIDRGMSPKEAVISASGTRLRPVLLTAITTVIGLLPMALGISIDFHSLSIAWESESSSWWSPMAYAVIFGLSFATVLTLFVVPSLTYLNLSFRKRHGAKSAT